MSTFLAYRQPPRIGQEYQVEELVAALQVGPTRTAFSCFRRTSAPSSTTPRTATMEALFETKPQIAARES